MADTSDLDLPPGGARAALARGELTLAAQSLRDLTTGRVAGAELLLRWRHPVLGDIAPGRFVRDLEREESAEGLREVGDWVLRRAVDLLARLAAAGCDIWIGVNVSPRQLATTAGRPVEFASEISALCAASAGASPRPRLVLEITEDWQVPDGPGSAIEGRVLRACRMLRAAGVRVGLDDYGEGDTAPRHLDSGGFDIVKFAPRWVEAALSGTAGATLLRKETARAHRLGLLTVAEGLETPAHVAASRVAGARFGQGYALARPLPVEVWWQELAAEEVFDNPEPQEP